jgi:hypothetical protein
VAGTEEWQWVVSRRERDEIRRAFTAYAGGRHDAREAARRGGVT